MSTSIFCPHCGQPPPPDRVRPGVTIHCERCQKFFTPPAQQPPLEPLVQPEMVFGSRSVPDVDGPSSATAFLAIFLIVGSIVLLCGGIGGYIAIGARKKIVAAAQNVEEVNQQRQRELEEELKPPPRPQPIPPKPARKAVPKPAPVPIPPPPPPREITPAVMPPVTEPVPAQPPKAKPRPPRVPTGKSLDELLTALNDEQSKRPAWVTLQELARLPAQEDRKADVSSAIERHLRSRDTTTSAAAAKAAAVWGTDWNGDALLELIDSPHISTRWEAIRALAKVRPTAETAELLLPQAGDVANTMALRDAFKDLGPLAEQAMLDCLESNDLKLKKSMMPFLGDIGSQSAVEPLEKVIRTEMDTELKGQAEAILRRIQSRLP